MHSVLKYLVFILATVLVSAFFGLFRNVLFYSGVLFGVFFGSWLFFGVPRVLVGRCKSCGSRHLFFSFSRGVVCSDCNFTFNLSALTEREQAKFIISFIAVPFSFMGICFIGGLVLAGMVSNFNLMFWGILLSVFGATFPLVLVGLLKLFRGVIRERESLGITLWIITFGVACILMLIGYILLVESIMKMFW